MQKTITKFLLIFVMIASISFYADAQALSPRKGVIRVKLQPEVAAQVGSTAKVRSKAGTLSTGVKLLDTSAERVKAVSIKRVFPYVAKFEEQRKKYGLDRWYEVTFDESLSPEQAKNVFKNTAGVQIAELEIPMELKDGSKNKYRKLTAADIAKMGTPKTAMPFNDPRLGLQWHYNNDGSMPGSVAGADINLFNAWKTETGKSNVLIAIIDGGVDYSHEDLAQNMWVNQKELNGKPGVDDDGDGYVDDIYGYNFVTKTGEIYPHSHGTHVAGTVGAVNNNGIGVCGVAGGDGTNGGVKMISCQVFDPRAANSDGNFAEAIVYAAEIGASIAQCSWGWGTAGYYEQAVLDAIDYFTEYGGGDNLKGGLCIFAAGNEGEEGQFYPACYEKTLAVTSMCFDKTAANYSCRGKWADVAAPGGYMDYDQAQGVLSTLPSNTYGYSEGTSMAAPHVSGIAALILSKYGSKNLLNETLRQQLVTSVNDFYKVNPSVEGLFGSGYIDAGKALQMGTGAAPSGVVEYTLTPSQDNILIEWVIPASSDNNVNHHIIYYSTTPFTEADDIDKLPNKVIDTKFYYSGDNMSYELQNLTAQTTYYIALKTFDRWGNAGPLSPVKTATTNAGPLMSIDQEYLTLEVDGAGTGVGSAKFNISNTNEGLLKWKYNTKTANAISSWSLVRPNPGKISTKAINLVVGESKVSEIIKTDEYSADDFPKSINYNTRYIDNVGESDSKLPNSLAQWFKIDANTYPDGFNLTHLRIGGSSGENPTIEIYKGDGTISKENLLQTVAYDFFAYNYDINLKEQLYFAPGESFWIVVHFDAGNVYPLGLGYTPDADYKGTCFMSNDLGKTWIQLPEALKGSPYETYGNSVCWAVTALSKNPDWSKLLTLSPEEGSIKNGESQEITVSNDGQKIVNGTYKLNLHITTNETENNDKTVYVTMNVTGNKPELTSSKVISFGDILVGETKKLNIEINNIGYGPFSGSKWGEALTNSNISSSSEHFVPTSYLATGCPARSKTLFEVAYSPKSAGSHTGTITLTDRDGNSYKFTVRGVATDPAKIEINPTAIDAGTLEIGTPVTKSFTIKNSGNYPLEYILPKYTTDTLTSSGKVGHRFGYEYISNINGATDFAYDNNPELLNATDITSQFSDTEKWSEPISLGFSFPFYGEKIDKVYISSFGGIAFNNEKSLRSPLNISKFSLQGVGMISAYGYEFGFGTDSKVEWAKQDGKFIVRFTNVKGVVAPKEYTNVSFHIVLSSHGDVEVYYDDYNPELVFEQGANMLLGVVDTNVDDPFTVTNPEIANRYYTTEPTEEGDIYKHIVTGTAVKIIAPDANFIKSVEPASGLINPGESATVTATLASDNTMYAGAASNTLALMSNDPTNGSSTIKFSATISGTGLAADTKLENSEIDFGTLFRTAVKRLPVTVQNVGTSNLTISSVSLTNSKFIYSIETPVVVKPGYSKDIVVTIPTVTEGEVSDVMTIVTDVATLTANIKGKVIGVPTATIDKTEFKETLESGTSKAETLTISNEGNEPLVYAITPNSIISLPVENEEGSTIDYIYKSATDDPSISTDWVDIETNGKGTQNNLTYFTLHDFVEVSLPFEFPFYGKKYTKMYVYNTGFVSFTKRGDEKIWPEPPVTFPEGTIYNNIIAPFWGLHSMGQAKTDGIFNYETNDQAIVSFMGYGNVMNSGICFQLILNKDGSFKFQYKPMDANADMSNTFGIAGISSEGAKAGFLIPDQCIAFNNAVEFYPVKTVTLESGANKVVNFDILANKLAGSYDSNIEIITNVPGKESIKIPVNLVITGAPKPVFPTKIEGEYVTGSTTPNGELGGYLEFPFTVSNEGTAPFTITDVEVNFPMGDFGPAMMLFDYGTHIDPFFGDETTGWSQYMSGTAMEIGSTPKKFNLALSDCYSIGTTTGDLTFKVTGIDGVTEVKLPVSVTITPAPAISFDKQAINVVNAADNYDAVSSFSIQNNGEYKLTYSLRLDPTGEGEEVVDDGGGVAPASLVAPKKSKIDIQCDSLVEGSIKGGIRPMESTSGMDMPGNFEHTNSLYYPALGTQAYNYGAGNTYAEFKGATYYKAPVKGFNLSHVYTAVNISTMDGADLKVDIVKGDDPAGTVILGHGTYHVDKQANPNMGQFIIIPLDKEVYLQPNQEFNVVITYPTGLTGPAYLITKEEDVISNRYMGYTDATGWYDVAAVFKDTYGSLGYITTCLETTEGSSWIKLETTETEGEIAIGESKKIDVRMIAKSAPLVTDNEAVIVIKSNDPLKPIVNYPITLSKNGQPIITLPEGTTLVNEGATVNVDIKVIEPDGDDFNISLGDNTEDIVNITSCTAIDPMETPTIVLNDDKTNISVSNCVNGVTLKLALAPTYGQEGTHSVTIQAGDSFNHLSNAEFNFVVSHVNRAPEAVKMSDIHVVEGTIVGEVKFADMFTDPDGDDMEYTYSITDNTVVGAMPTATGLTIAGFKEGETTIIVTATDENGSVARNFIKVIVEKNSGVETVNIDSDVTIYPNPVVTAAHVTCNFDSDKTTYRLYTSKGERVYEETASKARGEVQIIDMTGLSAGVYLLQVEANGATTTLSLIKK